MTIFAAILAVVVLDTSNSAANAAGLFDPATANEMRAATSAGTMRDGLRGANDGSRRNRLVTLNTGELSRIVPADADNAGDRLQRARALSSAVTIDLFPDVSVTAQRTNVEAPEEGGFVWVGRGAKSAAVTLAITDGRVYGHVQTDDGKIYSIEPVAGQLHRIAEIDQSNMLRDIHLPVPPGLQKKSETGDARIAETGAVSTINVMVANTVAARAECSTSAVALDDKICMQARINMAIALANTAFTNSGVLIKYVRVGGANEITYADVTSYGTGTSKNYTGLLCDLSGFANSGSCAGIGNNQTAKFAALRTKRNAVAADLVVLMRKAGAACGIAWVPDPPTAGYNIYGYSVVTSTQGSPYNCLEGFTFSHETGHNLGLHHDRFVEPNASNSKFNYGYVNTQPAGRFREIMSYPDRCTSLSILCTRVNYFSTPLKQINGLPLGIAAGNAGAADAVRALNATRVTVSAYR